MRQNNDIDFLVLVDVVGNPDGSLVLHFDTLLLSYQHSNVSM
jgi:hypothetical protein